MSEVTDLLRKVFDSLKEADVKAKIAGEKQSATLSTISSASDRKVKGTAK